ncbi:nudix hydrolase 2-like isoform X2 [Asparagus officinalis]|uniref:nudix hydrolase 2-like isoform X2 n=1 Tax=Asparagus officinalis TaxID=4686 RepID=UPI00098E0DFE|nr:nudix hydrolase 2-like isoform X2 [Asparagus officinalis]
MLRSRSRALLVKTLALRLPLNHTLVQSFPQISSLSNSLRLQLGIHKGFKRIVTSELGKSSSVMADRVENLKLLTAVNDHHGGVVVELKAPMDAAAFVQSLRASIAYWRQQGKKGVWIKLPIELANLVQPTVEEGFWYHHAEPSYLMLVYWIPATPHTLPVNASHRVGVGGFVVNSKKEVLVVQEKTGMLQGSGIWKFPTGVVDQGEDIFAGAMREVKEETGIDTEFVEVLAFRFSSSASKLSSTKALDWFPSAPALNWFPSAPALNWFPSAPAPDRSDALFTR